MYSVYYHGEGLVFGEVGKEDGDGVLLVDPRAGEHIPEEGAGGRQNELVHEEAPVAADQRQVGHGPVLPHVGEALAEDAHVATQTREERARRRQGHGRG